MGLSLESPEATNCSQPDGKVDPGALSRNLGWLLSQMSHALVTMQTARMEGIGLLPRGYCVLAGAMEGSYTQSELAKAIGLDKTTMVVTMDGLEEAGLAERLPSPTDRRARVIHVTEAGRAKVAEAERIVEELQEEILSTLGQDERRALLDALERLATGPLSAPVACSGAPRRRAPKP